MKHTHWYEAKTGNHQGLIVEENTGRNVAVSYDKADARLIAAAPELFEELKALTRLTKVINAVQHAGGTVVPEMWSELYASTARADAIIARTEGRE